MLWPMPQTRCGGIAVISLGLPHRGVVGSPRLSRGAGRQLMYGEAAVFRAHDDRPTDGVFSEVGGALQEQHSGKALSSPMHATLDRARGATTNPSDFGIGKAGRD